MAASLGLGHDTYSYSPASLILPPIVADSAEALNFPPAAMPDDIPELNFIRPPDHSPPPQFGSSAGETEMSMYGNFPMLYYSTGEDAVRRGNNNGARSARIGFRTRSEVEIMDDGFKWRKYGKKAVKSSPNPRNYYRCSVEGCGVKKRVERDRDDPRYVLTTYDGVHNHATPGTAGHHLIGRGASPAASYSAPSWNGVGMEGLVAPTDAWGPVQLHAAAHSSESSY